MARENVDAIGRVKNARHAPGIAGLGGGRGQSALEYLMTYSWAFLILTTVIAVLFFSGVIDLLVYAGNDATGFSTVKVMRFDIFSSGNISLLLANDADVSLQVKSIKLDNRSLGGVTVPFDMQPGEQVLVSGNAYYPLVPGQGFRNVPLEITYRVIGGSRDHLDAGTLSGKAT